MKTETCAKCESGNLKDAYNGETDNLDRTCMNCGYVWQEASADNKSAERIIKSNSK